MYHKNLHVDDSGNPKLTMEEFENLLYHLRFDRSYFVGDEGMNFL